MDRVDLSPIVSELRATKPTKHTFDELYNGKYVPNPANGKYYYTVDIYGRIFLQNIVPYVNGMQPLNDDNIDEVIEQHKDQLIEDFVASEKETQAVKYFKGLIS